MRAKSLLVESSTTIDNDKRQCVYGFGRNRLLALLALQDSPSGLPVNCTELDFADRAARD